MVTVAVLCHAVVPAIVLFFLDVVAVIGCCSPTPIAAQQEEIFLLMVWEAEKSFLRCC